MNKSRGRTEGKIGQAMGGEVVHVGNVETVIGPLYFVIRPLSGFVYQLAVSLSNQNKTHGLFVSYRTIIW